MSSENNFIFEDFEKSGINRETIDKYIKKGYLTEDDEGWTLYYEALTANNKTEYYIKRLKNSDNKGKYRMPKGISVPLFRPIDLDIDIINNPDQYLILTEGAKKAIKAVQEGFNCLSLNGTWNWKQNPIKAEDENSKEKTLYTYDEELYVDIIPDIANADWENKQIYLCYDSDMWRNPKVKSALYQLAAYLISEKKAIVKIILLPNGETKGLDDYLIAKGNESFQKLIDNANVFTLKDIRNALSDRKNLIDFPLDVFPDNIAELINDMHKKYDAAKEYIASVFLSVVSILICGHFSINAKPDSNWIEYPILWVALIGNPSQKKTPCLKIGKDILDEFDRVLQSYYETEMLEYKNQLDRYKKNKKDKKTDRQIKEPIMPHRARFSTQNVTIESLFDIIKANESYRIGVSIYIDELAFLFNGFNQYKKSGNDKQYFLQSWSKSRQNIVRKGSKIDYTVDVGHNIIGGIQPKVLNKTLLREGIESTDGMVERWLYSCSDYFEQGFSDNEKRENYSFNEENTFEKLCSDIFKYIIIHNKENQIEFSFSSDAQKLFIKFCNYIMETKKSNKLSDIVKSYLQKQTNYVARLALVLQIFYNFKCTKISVDTLIKAIKISKYFINCFKYVINEKIETNPIEDSVISYLTTKDLKSISPTQLYKSNENRYKTLEKARNILEHLAQKGYGRLVKAKNGVKFIFYGI